MQSLSKHQSLDLVYFNEPDLQLHYLQEEGSSLRLFVVDTLSATNDIVVEHCGPGCFTQIYHLTFLENTDRVSTHTHIKHNVGGGTSRQLLKYVLSDRAQGDFFGELYIAPDAQQTDAQQTNRNLLLSPAAIMHTRPQLEIYADDVKASHGASTGQLDESALFYMQQRCLDPTVARAMLIRAFMDDVVTAIPQEDMRARIEQELDARFRIED